MAGASFYGSTLKLNTATRHSQTFRTSPGSFIRTTVAPNATSSSGHKLYNYASQNHTISCTTGTNAPGPLGDCLVLLLTLVSSQDAVCHMAASLVQITLVDPTFWDQFAFSVKANKKKKGKKELKSGSEVVDSIYPPQKRLTLQLGCLWSGWFPRKQQQQVGGRSEQVESIVWITT